MYRTGATMNRIFHTRGVMVDWLVRVQPATDVTKSTSGFTAPDVAAQLYPQVKLHVARAHLAMDLVRTALTAPNVVKGTSAM